MPVLPLLGLRDVIFATFPRVIVISDFCPSLTMSLSASSMLCVAIAGFAGVNANDEIWRAHTRGRSRLQAVMLRLTARLPMGLLHSG